MSGFDNYKVQYDKIQKELIGLTTANGIEIKSQSKHFIERVIGSREDPTKSGKAALKPRSGVKIEDIKDALMNPHKNPVTSIDSLGRTSIKYTGEYCDVTISDVGNLIQTNPRGE